MTTPTRKPWDHAFKWWMYSNGKCRCNGCRNAWRARVREVRASNKVKLAADPTIRPHGKTVTYQEWGCRCADCRAAMSEARKHWPSVQDTGHAQRERRQRRRTQPFGREWMDGLG